MTPSKLRQHLELLGAFSTAGGRTPLAYQQVCAPTEAEVHEGWLIWSPGFMNYKAPPRKERAKNEWGLCERMKWNFRDPSPETLVDFMQLAEAPDEAIRKFVLRWGALSICRDHLLPSSHRSLCGVRRVPRRTYVYAEPIECYRFFARQAGALIRYAIAVRAGHAPDRSDDDALSYRIDECGRTGSPTKPPISDEAREHLREFFTNSVLPLLDENASPEFWRQLAEDLANPRSPRRCQGYRNVLATHVNTWLGLGYVRPHLQWTGTTPQVLFGVGAYPAHESLFGNLALQLLVAVSGAEGVAICSSCGRPYSPRRAPARGRLRYCRDCGMRAAWKIAQRKRRAKERAASELPIPTPPEDDD